MTTADAQHLQLACSINSSFQVNIQHADAKAGMLAATCSGMVIAMLSQSDTIRDGFHGAGLALGPGLAAWTLALVAAARYLARAVRPRITPPSPDNRFSFPAVAAAAGPVNVRHATTKDLCDEAWALNHLLANIATTKYSAISAALTATAGLAMLTLACLTYATMVA